MKEKGFGNPINVDNNNTDKKFFQEIECNCPTCNDSRYVVDGDSDYSPPFKELKGGKISVDLDAIADIEREERFKRLEPATKNILDNDY